MHKRNKVYNLEGDLPDKILTKMERGQVPILSDGDQIIFDFTESKLAIQCCDCGLVHHFDFKVVSPKELSMSTIRDNYTTVKYRMNNGVIIKNKEKINIFRRLFWKGLLIIEAIRRQNTTVELKISEK